jgi:hypothetical protein
MLPFNTFLHDEHGFVLSSEALMFGTIVVIGLLVGIDSIQDAVVQELGDFAETIGFLDQSFSYTGVLDDTTSTRGSEFEDTEDLNDNVPLNMFGINSET